MDIEKLLNPKVSTEQGQPSEDKGKRTDPTKSLQEPKKDPVQEGQKDWEDNMKGRGMPIQGLNTFRVKKQG